MAQKRGAAKGKKKVANTMREFKQGSLKSGSGAKVKKRKQAVAIALNHARKSGAKIPKKKKKS
jgi:dihydroxyacetone kinase